MAEAKAAVKAVWGGVHLSPEDYQAELNHAYELRLEALKKASSRVVLVEEIDWGLGGEGRAFRLSATETALTAGCVTPEELAKFSPREFRGEDDPDSPAYEDAVSEAYVWAKELGGLGIVVRYLDGGEETLESLA